jgi:hypothetical protein
MPMVMMKTVVVVVVVAEQAKRQSLLKPVHFDAQPAGHEKLDVV